MVRQRVDWLSLAVAGLADRRLLSDQPTTPQWSPWQTLRRGAHNRCAHEVEPTEVEEVSADQDSKSSRHKGNSRGLRVSEDDSRQCCRRAPTLVSLCFRGRPTRELRICSLSQAQFRIAFTPQNSVIEVVLLAGGA